MSYIVNIEFLHEGKTYNAGSVINEPEFKYAEQLIKKGYITCDNNKSFSYRVRLPFKCNGIQYKSNDIVEKYEDLGNNAKFLVSGGYVVRITNTKMYCGFIKSDGNPCKSLSGRGTKHFGTGYCSLHEIRKNVDVDL